jgi:hypothetical protein
MAKPDLSAERLRELLHYDQETGVFTWRVNRKGHAKIGSIAGSRRWDGYVSIGICGKAYLAHRLAWLHVKGVFPKEDIDHLDGNPSNNAIKNLRDCPTYVNVQNIRGPSKNNKSGFLGVSRNKKRWLARIHVSGKTINIGTFDTAEEAADAYIKQKRLIHAGCTI